MQPFDDIDVIDFTQEVSGPHCTQLLAMLGANVVKIEPPEGARTRDHWTDAFVSFNMGGKRSLSVDLKTDEGNQIIRELAEKADVIVENFRPGVLEQFELDYESVSETNETIVYCSISGFGQDGPYQSYPAYDPIAQALGGIMSQTGYPDRPPVRIGASFIDCGTAVHAAFFIAGALLDRERTGEGHYIDTSLFDTVVSWMAYSIAHYDRTGETSRRNGTGNSVTDRLYETGDGEFVYVKAITQAQYERLCDVVDRPDLVRDDRFATREAREEHAAALESELQAVFQSYERDEITSLLASVNVPAGAVQDVAAVVDSDPHVTEREMLERSYDPVRETEVTTASLPIRTEDGKPEFKKRPPGQGQHNREILSEIGYTDCKIDELRQDQVIHRDT